MYGIYYQHEHAYQHVRIYFPISYMHINMMVLLPTISSTCIFNMYGIFTNNIVYIIQQCMVFITNNIEHAYQHVWCIMHDHSSFNNIEYMHINMYGIYYQQYRVHAYQHVWYLLPTISSTCISTCMVFITTISSTCISTCMVFITAE